MKTYYVNWHGPYTYEDICDSVHCNAEKPKDLSQNGLYVFIGKRKYAHSRLLQYVGITEGSFQDRFYQHHKRKEINRELSIWLGKIIAPKRHDRGGLESVEHMLAYFTQPSLNEKKTCTPPTISCAVISRFYFAKSNTLRKRIPLLLQDIPDVMLWDHDHERFHYSGRLNDYTI